MEFNVADRLNDLHSEEVQEIIGKPPHWILSWGITLLLIIVLMVFAGSYFFRYPDVIAGEIMLTCDNDPSNLDSDDSVNLNRAFDPSRPGRIWGKLRIPVSGSGKVKAGQRVNIKLLNYPFMEFGALQGRITKISPIQQEKSYLAEVILPNGLVTTYGKKLAYLSGMSGSAEIITAERRLIERIFQPVRLLVDN